MSSSVTLPMSDVSVSPSNDPRDHPHTGGVITWQPARRRICLDARPLPLTTIEYEVFALLVAAAGRVVSRDELIERAFGRSVSPIDRALDVHISHLRRKLGAHRSLILTVRGIGYMLCG